MSPHKNIESPERFWELFLEFREFKQSQKIKVPIITKMGPDVLEHTPPLTWAGFDAWLYEEQIISHTEDYRSNKENRYADYAGVIKAITNIMYTNKFEGAAVGAYNANIISRDLGLADKKEVEHSGGVKQIFKIGDTEIEL